MNLHEILQLSPENLDESQKDEVCNEIKWIDIDAEDINISRLKTLFKMSQQILKYKDEQVDSLMTEFDELARKQGTEEAKLIRSLENEIKSLRSSSESRLQTPDIDLLKEIENFKSKIKNLKVNLKMQIQETEKLQSNILILQEEKLLLQSELHQIHDSDSQSEVSEVTDKHQILTENLRQKNKQISQLLSDIEFVEKENISLKESVIQLRDKLNEATEHITQMTSEISGQKTVLQEYKDKLDLNEENTALRNQIEDLVNQKNERDIQLDHFSMTLDSKVEELKQVLQEKQTEIKELKSRNIELEKKISDNENKIPVTVLMEREEQIIDLQTKLKQATQEIEKTTSMLNKISTTKKQCVSSGEQDIIIDDLKAQLVDSHARCQELQQQLDSTERDAQNYTEQFVELMNRLYKYEEGQYGLSDALREMQDCRLQINIRDKQIAELIQNCNKLQSMCDEVEHENLTLREKLGLPLDAPVSKNGIISKQRKQKKLIKNLQNQIELLEDEKLQMKVELQKYKRSTELQTDTRPYMKDEVHSKSEQDYKKQITEMAEENEALRKGMHEILESIRAKNESGDREIKSQTLEQLLQILDVRHVTGWYHPAMRLQAELNTLQGTNAELRNQLQITRSEINVTNEESRKAETKIQELQQKIEDLSKSNKNITSIDSSFITSLVVPPNISATSAEIISKLNSHLLIVLNEYNNEVQNTNNLKEKLENSKQEINTIRHQTGLLYKQYIAEKQVLSSKCEEMQLEKHTLMETIKKLQSKLEKCINIPNSVSEVDNIAVKLSNDLVSLNRKCLYLEENEKKLISENAKLKTEICDARSATSECIKDLEIFRNNLAYKVSILEKALRDTVPKNKLESCTRALYELTAKYRELLQDIDQFKEHNNVMQYKKQIELLNSEKEGLFCELLKLKCKTGPSEHANVETAVLSNKVMTLELNEMKEKQRADHVNNLYELVKEQLNKCEEKCSEITNQNKILLNTNLKLQLAQQELQDKLVNSTTHEELQKVQEKLISTETEFQNLKNKYEKLLNRNSIIEAEIKTREMFKSSQNMELTNLKHLLLDLQSTSDDKALIARLGTEVVLARICESEAKNKLDILTNELQQTKDERKYAEMLLEESYMKFNNIQNQFQMKCRFFEQILYSVRTQYLGCSPLSSQERYADMMRQMIVDKQTTFTELQSVQKQKNNIVLLQEQLNLEIKNTLELKTALLQSSCNTTCEKIIEWYKEKNALQLNELKCRRNLEINELQLEQSLQRLKKQDIQLAQLEEELLKTSNTSLNNTFFTNLLRNSNSATRRSIDKKIDSEEKILEKIDTGTDPHCVELVVTKSSAESQTDTVPSPINNKSDEIISSLQEQIRQANEIISLKDSNLQRQQMSIAELEKNVEILKDKLQESNKRVHISENVVREPRQQVNVIDEVDLEEHNALKSTLSKLQVIITQKEDTITKYEQLLKQGRDEHSLAASRLQEEIKHLQTTLQQQQQAYQELKNAKAEPSSTDLVPNRTAIEQYVSQVHILEAHMAELQTTVSSVNSQLQASRQESVRWRTLANDRLKSIETLRKEYDDQHREEITTYRDEFEKYKEENITIKQELSKLRLELSQKNSNTNQVIQEKDTKLHELNMTVMQLKNELKLLSENEQNKISPELSELEMSKQLLENELEAYKKRFEQISAREKSAREEIRNLRGQLIKRPVLSARSDRGDKVKEQLQKKISTLEKELSEANERLEKEAAFNEARRVKITEDFTLWEKQKKWQQAAEKCKEKLNVKNEELEKLQQSYNSAKTIINRLEREKHILEGKLKAAKNSNTFVHASRLEILENENSRLKNEIETLNTKLEMQHYHSGGLGASMLQEKLEAQERKIAILELSAKGTNEVSAELERLHNTVASLKKANLRLEAENLELGIDLKKVEADTPYLREQIHHLDRYIEALKSEREVHHVVTNAGDQPQSGNKKLQELEKTILSLKRLVEKLQVENKRLQSRPCSSTSTDRKMQSDKLQMELKKIREQYAESIQRSVQLEDELDKSQRKVRFLENDVEVKRRQNESSLRAELSDVKAQLVHKSQLLDKVKILLQKAALKEKYLQDQITQMKDMMSPEEENTNLD